MASYAELFNLWNNGDLNDRMSVAVADVAFDILAEDPATANHAERYTWAARAFADPRGQARRVMAAVLVSDIADGKTIPQIIAAPDAGLKTAVASVVDVFATNG